MKETFADSFYWIALVNPQGHYHAEAVAVSATLTGHLATTEAVLVEVADALSDARFRHLAVQIVKEAREDPGVSVVPWSPPLFERAFDLYTSRPDKGWSLTDCVSCVVMQEQGITEVLTGDRHFAQMGFRALLLMNRLLPCSRGRDGKAFLHPSIPLVLCGSPALPRPVGAPRCSPSVAAATSAASGSRPAC
ncbi:MAG: type II toxin-antitoxin system VapC family toxin [Armatimonadetes bacterium]|nr:type II toxin-antitoxin system VapC family toxin [Armatimonadota bacterium]